MPARAILAAFMLVFMVAFLVFITEMVLPLAIKSRMNTACRKTLISMEIEGRLTYETEKILNDELIDMGFVNIRISADQQTFFGEVINLNVTCEYEHNTLTSFFARTYRVYNMSYKRSCIVRKVVN